MRSLRLGSLCWWWLARLLQGLWYCREHVGCNFREIIPLQYWLWVANPFLMRCNDIFDIFYYNAILEVKVTPWSLPSLLIGSIICYKLSVFIWLVSIILRFKSELEKYHVYFFATVCFVYDILWRKGFWRNPDLRLLSRVIYSQSWRVRLSSHAPLSWLDIL